MPILDPSLQYFLVTNDKKHKTGRNSFAFFFKYLQIASRNLHNNLSTYEASFQFKKDLRSSLSLVNDEFGCNFSNDNDFENPKIKDYYKFLFDKIQFPDKLKESRKNAGTYKLCNDQFNTKLYQPCILFSEYHSWYFTDTPIAILSINSADFSELDQENAQKVYQYIKLEIDLMSASGLTLVLCYNSQLEEDTFLYQIIQDNQFSELHINIFNKKTRNLKNFLIFMKENFYESSPLKGFIYLYSYFLKEHSQGWLQMKLVKKIPRLKAISFSLTPSKALKKVELIPTKPFPHCKTGFDNKYLRIYLSYVPVYQKRWNSSSKETFTNEITGLCNGYISPEDFLFLNKNQVNILLDDEKWRNLEYAVNFEDVHLVRPDLFVNDTLALTPMDERMHELIDEVQMKVNKELEENKNNLIKSHIKSSKNDNYMDIIPRIAFAYTYLRRKEDIGFSFRNTQIYTVIETCQSFFEKKNEMNSKNHPKGTVFQIKTGEGKSCIVCLIAAVLAIKHKTVHVVSSNIKLCNRDYLESLEFFKLLDLKPAVLLHKNELSKNDKNATDEKSSTEDNTNSKEEKSPRLEKSAKERKSSKDEKSLKDEKSSSDVKSTDDVKSVKDERYPDAYFADDLFENPLQMNFAACGLDYSNNVVKAANVIFSTFVNFECFYLHMMENCPGHIGKYFKKCSLLIDEVDSILIDEITNGTIVSREMRTNAKEVLSIVYNNYKEDIFGGRKSLKRSIEDTLNQLKEMPSCDGITEEDVKQMYKEIKLVNSEKFSNGKKYIIETFHVKNNQRIKNMMKKLVQKVQDFPSNVWQGIKEKIVGEKDSDSDEDEEEDEEEELDTSKTKEFKRIVPFDFDHKGIPEPNKEFSGFIPQFIALKERDNKEKDLLFKDLSINYLYVSHPIFALMYTKICGFTGTVGNHADKTVLSRQYQLATKKVARYMPNLRVDFPRIACSTIRERNEKIVEEVLKFHEAGNPVLVIFQDFNEIDEVEEMIKEATMNNKKKQRKNNISINIFNGKDEMLRPDLIGGAKGAISLGTNICGRGTNIICSSSYPLHVIVAYYQSNTRVMEQAFGRTARNGQVGTCRCICLKSQLCLDLDVNPNKISKEVNEVDMKADKLKQFLNYFQDKHPWIFEFDLSKQDFDSKSKIKDLKQLRRCGINVNRIIAYKYKFPMFMTCDQFFEIQAQKIMSLFNCPNCKYTWRIFQRYIREMILQSWSLMIKKLDQESQLNKKSGQRYNMTPQSSKENINMNSNDHIEITPQSSKENLNVNSNDHIEMSPLSSKENLSMNSNDHIEITPQPSKENLNVNFNDHIEMSPQSSKESLSMNSSDRIEIKSHSTSEIFHRNSTALQAAVNKQKSFEERLNEEYHILIKKIEEYLPKETPDMVSAFIYIANEKVIKKYETQILKSVGTYPKSESGTKRKPRLYSVLFGSKLSTCLHFGFRPISLYSKSGARINSQNIGDTNFIKDPELSYERKTPNNKICKLSITERIDDLFNMIFQKISSMLGERFFLRLFLRRTLAGCEFGICLDLCMTCNEEKLKNFKNLLVDKDPLFVLTIFVNSMKPVLAGILICVLVYLAKIGKDISMFVATSGGNLIVAAGKKLIEASINYLTSSVISGACDLIYGKIIDFLNDVLTKQMKNIVDENFYHIIEVLQKVVDPVDSLSDNFMENLEKATRKEFSFSDGILGDFLQTSSLLKVSLLLILCLATFIKRFVEYREAIKYEKRTKEETSKEEKKARENAAKEEERAIKNAAKYEKAYDKDIKDSKNSGEVDENKQNEFTKAIDKMVEEDQKIIFPEENSKKSPKKSSKQDEDKNDRVIDFDSEELKEIDFEKIIELKKYEIHFSEYLSFPYKEDDSLSESSEESSNSEASTGSSNKEDPISKRTYNCINIKTKKRYKKIYYDLTKIKKFFDYVSFFTSAEKHPVILPFNGYALNGINSYFLFENKMEEYLEYYYLCNYGNKRFSSLEEALIFVYGIASAMEFLIKNMNDDLLSKSLINPNNILLHNDLYPLIFAMETNEKNDRYLAPELLKKPNSSKNKATKTNVFYLGILMCIMSVDFFCDINQFLFDESSFLDIFGDKSRIVTQFGDEWKNLIIQCIDKKPDNRPSFSEICDNIESNYADSTFDSLNKYIESLKPYR
ncbi:hypothetical protein M9Y10_004137 [Tritrichomonas musculus]|uniref:Uncharacterized protein n=1 Tax=Tritrichomonas musculus TaxID=1915356 RepID=A0ABR2JRJ7_9EUKA